MRRLKIKQEQSNKVRMRKSSIKNKMANNTSKHAAAAGTGSNTKI